MAKCLRRLRLILLAAAILLVGCDHATKYLAKRSLEHESPSTLVPQVFDLTYLENRDTGFQLLRGVPERVRTPILTSLQIMAGSVFLLLGLRRRSSRLERGAFLLIAAGALGNGIDRLVRGYVVDFLHLHHWPVFNVADIYITAGAVLLVIASRTIRHAPARPNAQPRCSQL